MKMKKITASLLLAACTFACACGSKGGNGGPKTGGVVTESDVSQYVEGMLHDVNVDFDAPVADFVVNGKTDYQLVYDNSRSNKAAGFIVEHVNKATGAALTMIQGTSSIEVNENTKYIFIGCEDLFVEMGGALPSYETLGVAGYQIQTVGKNVFINTYGTLGAYQMGAIAFLREVLGYDMFSEDCVIYEKDGTLMPSMDIVERPDFDYRQANGTSVSNTELYGMGYNYTEVVMNTGESWVHNIYDFVSLEDAVEHPEWLSNDVTQYQMCYTARGDKESYTELIYHIAEKIKTYLKAKPDTDTIIIGQHDITPSSPSVQNCKCAACQASYSYYGTMGAAWLSLCNRASVVVDEWLKTPEAIAIFGENKSWNLLQLVYHTQVNPPVEKDNNGYIYVDGKGVPLEEMWFNTDGSMENWATAWEDADTGARLEDELIAAWSDTHEKIYTAPNVHYMYATSQANWIHSYYEEENAGWKNICDGWAGVSGSNAGTGGGEFFVWAYTLNSKYALYPYNSFDTSWETTRYFKRIGAKYMFWQSHYENKNNSGFTKLKNYLDSKVEFDVNADYMFYVKKFFKNYFGVAGDTMLEYFEQVQAHCRWIEKVNQVSGTIHTVKYGNAENWPEGTITGWMEMMEGAYVQLEEAYKASNPALLEVYTRHIMIEEQFPLIVLCTTYADSYEPAELKALRSKFMNIFYDELENTVHAESKLMTEITNTWDMD